LERKGRVKITDFKAQKRGRKPLIPKEHFSKLKRYFRNVRRAGVAVNSKMLGAAMEGEMEVDSPELLMKNGGLADPTSESQLRNIRKKLHLSKRRGTFSKPSIVTNRHSHTHQNKGQEPEKDTSILNEKNTSF